ncbi:MAG: hypothetical protein L6Q57_00155 [Alphaproteobacteria bacterium]|nr:hypothetical protein [Alphaproteobacteria bacterium]
MDFVFFGYDLTLANARHLIAQGHHLRALFTFPCDNVFNFNREVMALGAELSIPVFEHAPQPADIANWQDQGAQVFLCAGYPFKIPPIDERRAYGLNLHPSLLPAGRGLMPVPHILLNHPEAAGFTVHKLAPRIDAGDILAQQSLPLHSRETVETYSARITLASPPLLARIFDDLSSFWTHATAQDETKASLFPPPDDALRTLNWTQPIARIDAIARAFGRYGCLAWVEGVQYVIYHLDTWAEPHNLRPGTVALRPSREIIVAAADGFVCIKDMHIN